MEKTVAVFPVLPGRDAREVAAIFQRRPDEYAESRRRVGVHLERAYEQPTPMGTMTVAYIESDRPFGDTTGSLLGSDLAVDREFLAAIKDVHGVDMTQPPPVDPPELIGDWVDEQVRERRRGMAFAAPIRPDAAEAARKFAKEAFEGRRDEHTESRRALGITHESVMLNHTPMGDVICVYLEGEDPAAGNVRFAASRSDYDAWFKEQCARIFVPDIDFNQPVPPVTELFDSAQGR